MEASSSTMAALVLVFLAALAHVFWHHHRNQQSSRKGRLPPGSIGLPFIGQTLSLGGALRSNTGEEWLRRWVSAYGPVSRLSVFGSPTAMFAGPAANKFIFTNPAIHPATKVALDRLIGRRTIRHAVSSADHGRLRAMMVQFLKVDAVKSYVGIIDAAVRDHLANHWRGHSSVAVLPSMMSLTFDIMCTAMFGLHKDTSASVRQQLSDDFEQLLQGLSAIPLELPFTTFRKALAASRRARQCIACIIDEKKAKLDAGESSPTDDLLTHMIAEGLPGEDIIDTAMLTVVVARDTTAVLITFLIRFLESNRDAYTKVVAEQEDVARTKAPEDALSWEDLAKMRYTWSAAMETMRLVPLSLLMLRKTIKDVEFNGYLVPKGWQVLQATTLTHGDPAIFPDPERFEPARFANMSAIPPFTFVPFGGGSRLCPGNEIARVQTLVTMHYIVTGFNWKLAAGCDGSFSRYLLPSPSQGLLIDIEPKETTSACITK